jgi:hypothetical protein
MRLPRLNNEETARLRDEWLAAIEALAHQVRQWAAEEGWRIREERRELCEGQIGAYEAPVLWIETPGGEIVLEPIARDAWGAVGRVDLYAYPSRYRVMLLTRGEGNWRIRTDSGLDWPHPWRKETFIELARGLTDAW